MSTTQETFDSRDFDNEERPLDVSIGVVKRLLLFAYEHYNEAYKTNAISVMSYWDGYIRACQHIIEQEKE